MYRQASTCLNNKEFHTFEQNFKILFPETHHVINRRTISVKMKVPHGDTANVKHILKPIIKPIAQAVTNTIGGKFTVTIKICKDDSNPTTTELLSNANKFCGQTHHNLKCPCHKYPELQQLDGHVLHRVSNNLPKYFNCKSRLAPSLARIQTSVSASFDKCAKYIQTKFKPLTQEFYSHCKLLLNTDICNSISNTIHHQNLHENAAKFQDILNMKTKYKDLVCTPIDKSRGDCAFMCPVQYLNAVETFYKKSPSYKKVQPCEARHANYYIYKWSDKVKSPDLVERLINRNKKHS